MKGPVSKKKILMVTSFYPPYHVGGACTHVYYLANALAQQGHDVHVLYSKDAYFLKRSSEPNESVKLSYQNHKNITLHEITTPLGRITPLLTYITSYIPFEKKIKEVMNEQFDFIHYHNISLFGPRIFSFGSGKKIYTAHDHWLITPLNNFYDLTKDTVGKSLKNVFSSLKHKKPPQLWRVTNLLENNLNQIDHIICPSHYLKDCFKEHGITSSMSVIPNLIPKGPSAIDVTKKSNIKNYFFFAGMLEPIKGISLLLSTFATSKENVVIAGTGSLQHEVETYAKKYHNIHYVGFLDRKQMYQYYHGAKAFILPSICEENCPSTIIEALSVGIPSLGPNRGGTPELLKLVDKDLIYKNDNLLHAVSSFDKKHYSKKELTKIYEDNFTPESYVTKFLTLIVRL